MYVSETYRTLKYDLVKYMFVFFFNFSRFVEHTRTDAVVLWLEGERDIFSP